MTKSKTRSKTKSKTQTKAQKTTQWYTLTTTRDGHPVRELPPKTYDSLDEARRAAKRLHTSLAHARETTYELDDNLFVTGRYRSKVCHAEHTTTDIGTISEDIL